MRERLDARRPWSGFALKAAASAATLGAVALAGLGIVRKIGPTSGWSARGARKAPPSEASLRDGYEVKDLSAEALTIILAALGGSAGLLVAIVFGMIWLFSTWDRTDRVGLTAEETAPIAVPGPHLQTQPFHDRAAETFRETQALGYYGWNGSDHATARVPLARAMVIVTGHSLDQAP